MVVDILLKLLGENPAGYSSFSDKASTIFADMWFSSFFWLPVLLVLIPWIWFIWHKKRGGKITKNKIIITMVASVFLFWLGSQLPWWIIEIMGGITVRGIYGGQL